MRWRSPIRARRRRIRAYTKVVPCNGARITPRLWRLEWLQFVEASPFYMEDGRLFRKSTGRPVAEEYLA